VALNVVFFLAVGVLLGFYVWLFYQVPILAVGVRNLRRSRRQKTKKESSDRVGGFPFVSIVVPVKDEERVVGRLLEALLRLRYPRERMEIVVVEDGSTDRTFEVCREYVRQYPSLVRVLRRSVSDGKPSALNYALRHVRGEILAFFDADSVPELDVLENVVVYFGDPSVAAVQGRLCSINADENMLTKFISYEETFWCETYLRGKDVLDLFVHLKGTCQFVRRDVLERVGGFDGDGLSEDMELSVRLVKEGYRVRYASDVRCWQETPSELLVLLRQRTRWFRGTMETAFKYGALMVKPSRKSLDAELTLLGPFILIASLLSYFSAFFVSYEGFNFVVLFEFLAWFSTVAMTVMLTLGGLALAYVSKPRGSGVRGMLSSLLWLPFVYLYWCLQALIAVYAAMLIVFGRPRKWVKTRKKGTFTSLPLSVSCSLQNMHDVEGASEGVE